MAASVFADFMTTALKDTKNQPFSVPEGMKFILVNRGTGISANQDPNGDIINEVFKPGQSPNYPQSEKRSENGPVVGGVF
jgi:penicillin-binding protein 1A